MIRIIGTVVVYGLTAVGFLAVVLVCIALAIGRAVEQSDTERG